MKKKLLSVFAMVMLAISIIACGSSDVDSGSAEVKRDLPEGNYEEMGEGTAYISTSGGTSENGNIPVIYADSEDSMMQIGLDAWDFNGGALSFVYVDGILIAKEQLANSQKTLTLESRQLSFGTHKVEIVQYENDDPSASMITYKTAEYEVKQK